MKKKLFILGVILLLLVMLVPIPTGVYKDGGTREYTALTYKIVKWHRLGGDYLYDKTRIYPFPQNFKSIDGLWYHEEEEVEHSFVATVLEIYGSSVVVEPVKDGASTLSGKISFSTVSLEKIDLLCYNKVYF